MSNITFQKSYFLAALFLLAIEVFIALFVRDDFFRPYGGDFLIILFLYCLVKSFFRIPSKNVILGVLLFAYFLELLQFLKVLKFFDLDENQFASVIFGNYFEWVDIMIYTLAGIFLLVLDWFLPNKFRKRFRARS